MKRIILGSLLFVLASPIFASITFYNNSSQYGVDLAYQICGYSDKDSQKFGCMDPGRTGVIKPGLYFENSYLSPDSTHFVVVFSATVYDGDRQLFTQDFPQYYADDGITYTHCAAANGDGLLLETFGMGSKVTCTPTTGKAVFAIKSH